MGAVASGVAGAHGPGGGGSLNNGIGGVITAGGTGGGIGTLAGDGGTSYPYRLWPCSPSPHPMGLKACHKPT